MWYYELNLPKANISSVLVISYPMLLLFTSGIYFSVRRSQDYILMRVLRENFDDGVDFNTDNYYDRKADKLVFNTYKTSASKGKQEVEFDVMRRKENGSYTNGFYNVKDMRYFKKYLLKIFNLVKSDFC